MWRSVAAICALLVLAANVDASLAASTSTCSVAAGKVLLTSCDAACGFDACVEYPEASKCPKTSSVDCQAPDANVGCTYQCLTGAYNTNKNKWTLFVRTPTAKNEVTSAPVTSIEGYHVPEDTKAAQISGFLDLNVTKGAAVPLDLDEKLLASAKTLDALTFTSLDIAPTLGKSGFLPTTVSELHLDNCKLTSIPAALANMKNLKTLSMRNNDIKSFDAATVLDAGGAHLVDLDLTGNGLTSFKGTLPKLETLTLSSNGLTAFPMEVFNMPVLSKLYLDDNSFSPLTVTQVQFDFLKRLHTSSKLGVISATSCGSGQTKETVLGSVVCMGNAGKKGSSSTVLIIIIVIVAVLIIAGAAFFLLRRRKQRTSAFWDVVNRDQTGDQTRSPTIDATVYGQPVSSASGTSTALAMTGGKGRASTPGSVSVTPSMPWAQSLGTGDVTTLEYIPPPHAQNTMPSAGSSSLPIAPVRTRNRVGINQNVVRIPGEDITYTRRIAKGAHGEVWLAQHQGQLVAVKKMLVTNAASVGNFVEELNLLSMLVHPRVLSLLGACWDDEMQDVAIVTEHMDSGDLLTVLRRRPPTELTWENGKAAYCMHICEALYYLHSLDPAIIHRDLKSRNVLVDARKGAKLSDFGESRERTIIDTMTAGVGTARWVAPEIIMGDDYSELADIYSLGVVLCELDTHKIPFEDLNLEETTIVSQVATGKLRPTVSDTCPEVIRRLTFECLQYDPKLRPSAARVLQTLMSAQIVETVPPTMNV